MTVDGSDGGAAGVTDDVAMTGKTLELTVGSTAVRDDKAEASDGVISCGSRAVETEGGGAGRENWELGMGASDIITVRSC